MKQISKEEWDVILNRNDKIKAILALRRNTGLGLVEAKRAIEAIWAGSMKLEDMFDKATPCTHCNGTGFTK